MPTTVSVDVYAKDRASSTFNNVGNAAHRSGGLVGKFGTTVAGVFTGAALYNGARDLVHVLGQMGESAAQDETAARRMALQFHNSANATHAQVAATEDWITAQGKALGIADDDLRPALTRAVTSTGNVAKAQNLVSLAMDISASKGKSLQSVTEALSKAQNGNISGLSKMGVAVKDADGKTRSLSDITKELTKTYSGQAAAAAGTTAGQYARLKVQISETGEAIGYKLLPYAVEFGEWALNDGLPALQHFGGYLQDELGPTVKDMQGWFSDNRDELEHFAKTVGEDVVSAMQTTVRVGGQVVHMFQSLPDPVKKTGIELAAAGYAFRQFNSAVAPLSQSITTFAAKASSAEERSKALGTAARQAAGLAGMAALVDSTQRSTGALSDLESVAGGAALGFSVGGPWGALVGGAGGGLIAVMRHLADGTDQAKEAFKFASPQAADFADQLNKVSGAATSAAQHTEALALQQSGALEAGRALGLSSRDLVKYTFGDEGAIRRVNKAIDESISKQITWTDSMGRTHTILQGNSDAAIKLSTALSRNTAAFEEGRKKAQDLALAGGDLQRALKGVQDRAKIVTAFETNGYPETKRQLAELLAQYDLTPKQLQTVIRATGISTSVNAVQSVIDRMNALHDKTVTLTTVTVNRRGGVTSSAGGHSASDPTNRTAGRSGGVVSGDYFGLGNNTLAQSGAALLASLVVGITKGKKPLDAVLAKVKSDVENKVNALTDLQNKYNALAGGFGGMQESVFATQATDAGPVTLDQLLAKSAAEKAKAASVDADVTKLLGMGISQDLIEQFQSQGSAGIDALHALAGATADQLKQVMDDNKAAQASYLHAGQVSADKFYAAQIDVAAQNLAVAQSVAATLTALQAWGDKVRFELQGDVLVAALAKEKKDKGKQ